MIIGKNRYLTLPDIYSLAMKNAYLVVLSGCETNLTAQTNGDELIGLRRGFLYAGAPRLLATLWRVYDAVMVKWISVFYAVLAEGNEPLSAMRIAMHSIRHSDDPALAHPVFWAGMEMVGVVD